ncbi:hypothetical protein [Streptomyces sp. NPDC054797]
MEFGAAFPADGEAFELVEQGEGLLHDVAELAHALDVRASLAGDHGSDPAFTQRIAVGVGVPEMIALADTALDWPEPSPGIVHSAIEPLLTDKNLHQLIRPVLGRAVDRFRRTPITTSPSFR